MKAIVVQDGTNTAIQSVRRTCSECFKKSWEIPSKSSLVSLPTFSQYYASMDIKNPLAGINQELVQIAKTTNLDLGSISQLVTNSIMVCLFPLQFHIHLGCLQVDELPYSDLRDYSIQEFSNETSL